MGLVDVKEQRNRQFNYVLERIRSEMVLFLKTMPEEAVEWFHRNLDFNVAGAKRDHVMCIADLTEILRGRVLSDDEYFMAAVLGWCIMLVHVSRLRVYSGGELHKRPGQCWYIGDDILIKDAYWLDAVMYHLLKKYFSAEKYYIDLIELFHDTTFRAGMGQLVGAITTSKDHVSLDKFSLEKYSLIAQSKATGYYLVVAVAMCVSGVPQSYTLQGRLFHPYPAARSIVLHLGEYVQIQRDFFDYLCTIGTDIIENKCSWCINAALAVASPEQRKVLQDNYGRMDPEKEMRVREIYEVIGLREQFRVYEARLREQIETAIADVPIPDGKVDGVYLKREVFTTFLSGFTRTK